MAHGGARPCSGLAELALPVASSPEHLYMMEKARRELEKEERSGAVLATESATPHEVRTAMEMKMWPLPWFFGSMARRTS